MNKIKKRKFNLGKLIVLLSCLLLITSMLLSVNLHKATTNKQENRQENYMNMETASVGDLRIGFGEQLVITISRDFVMTNNGLEKQGGYVFVKGSHNNPTYFEANKFHTIFFNSSFNQSVNLLDLVKTGVLSYDVEYSVCVSVAYTALPGYKTFTILSPFNIGFSDEILAVDNNTAAKYYFYDGVTTNQETIINNAEYSEGYDSIASGGTKNIRTMCKKGYLKFGTMYSVISSFGERENRRNSNILQIQIIKDVVPLPETPVEEGHTFVGWYYDEALTIPYDNQAITKDTDLYAKFEINQYSVTFDSVGAANVPVQTVNWNTSASLPTPTKEGHVFLGWFNGSTQYTNEGIKTDTKLTAKWEVLKYTVNFFVKGKVYKTLKVDYGSALSDTMAAQGMVYFKVVNDKGEQIGSAQTIKAETTVLLAAMTTAEKVGTFLANNTWILFVSGGLNVILIIAVIFLVKKRR